MSEQGNPTTQKHWWRLVFIIPLLMLAVIALGSEAAIGVAMFFGG